MLVAFEKISLWRTALSLLFLTAAITLVRLWKATSRPRGFPPGPKALPFIGNLHQIPSQRAFLQYHKWHKIHGSILGLKFGTMNVVVLSSWHHVKELYEKRGAIYSGRAPGYIGDNIIYPNEVQLLFISYGPIFRAMRRAINSILNTSTVTSFLPIQEAEALKTLHGLISSPEKYPEHIRRYTAGVIISAIFGQRVDELEKSSKVKKLYELMSRVTAMVEPSSAPPVDLVPALKWLPKALCWWKKEAYAVREGQLTLYSSFFNETKARMEEGRANGCFMEGLIRDQEKYGLSEERLIYLGGMMVCKLSTGF